MNLDAIVSLICSMALIIIIAYTSEAKMVAESGNPMHIIVSDTKTV